MNFRDSSNAINLQQLVTEGHNILKRLYQRIDVRNRPSLLVVCHESNMAEYYLFDTNSLM